MLRSHDLERLALSRSQIATRVRRGEARVVRPGVWSLDPATTPEASHRELIGATFPGLRDGAVLSHASAAVLHGLPAPAGALNQVHVTRPGRSSKRAHFLFTHRADLRDDDVIELDGLPVTSLELTVIDCARSLEPMDALAAVDSALRRGLDHPSALGRLAGGTPRRGYARARNLIAHGDGRAESAGESWSRWRMIETGIPLPDLQVRLCDAAGAEIARCDFDWPDIGLVGEFDGAIKYGRLLRPGQDVSDVIMAEKQREERIRRTGRWLIRWTAADLHPASRFRALMAEAWRLGRRSA